MLWLGSGLKECWTKKDKDLMKFFMERCKCMPKKKRDSKGVILKLTVRNDIFISYHSQGGGETVAEMINSTLKAKKYMSYYNAEQHTGEFYPIRLHREVKNCKVLLWLLTKNALKEKQNGQPNWFFAELLWAVKYKKQIFFLVANNFNLQEIKKENLRKKFKEAFEILVNHFTHLFSEDDTCLVDKAIDEVLFPDKYNPDRIFTSNDKKKEGLPYNTGKANYEEQLENFLFDPKDGLMKRIKRTPGLKFRIKRNKKMLVYIHRCLLCVMLVCSISGGIIKYFEYKKSLVIWDGSQILKNGWRDVKGDGSKEAPYQIDTAVALAYLAYTSQYKSYKDTYFELKKDITLNHYNIKGSANDLKKYSELDSQHATKNQKVEIIANAFGYNGEVILNKDDTHEWLPIGCEEYPFEGNFEGNNHTIYGVYIDEDKDYQGFFGKCSKESRIENLNLVAANVSAESYVGAIAGETEGLINGCSVYSALCEGKRYVGGVAGRANVVANIFSMSYINNSYEGKERRYIHECFGGIVGDCNYLINSEGMCQLAMLDDVCKAGGLAGKVEKLAYKCVLLGTSLRGYESEYYVGCDDPITICDVFGLYDGKETNNFLIFRNANNVMGIQMDKEIWKEMLKSYGKYFGNIDTDAENNMPFYMVKEKDFGRSFDVNSKLISRDELEKVEVRSILGSGKFWAHEYCTKGKRYNTLSQEIEFKKGMSNKLNKVININEKEYKELKFILTEYGKDSQPLSLAEWTEQEKGKSDFYNISIDFVPLIKNVELAKENWKIKK